MDHSWERRGLPASQTARNRHVQTRFCLLFSEYIPYKRAHLFNAIEVKQFNVNSSFIS